MPYVSIACVITYVIGHAIGPSESEPTSGYLHTLITTGRSIS